MTIIAIVTGIGNKQRERERGRASVYDKLSVDGALVHFRRSIIHLDVAIPLRQNVITEEFYGECGGFNEKYWIPITTRVSHWEDRGEM